MTDGQTTWFSLSKMVSRQLICGIGGGCLIKRRCSPASLGNCLLLLRSVLPQMIRLHRVEGCLRCLSAVYEHPKVRCVNIGLELVYYVPLF